MKWIFHPLLLLIAASTESELAKQVEFLKAENQMLRKRLAKRICLSDEEKRLLVKLGQAIGSGVRALITIVSYPTYRRYVSQINQPQPKTDSAPRRKPGRPRTSEEIRELVLKLARENDWGYTRILGELKKLGIKTSRSTIVNILKQAELDPKTDPGKGTWADFLKAHGESLWQCDFFSKHIVTPEGLRQCFLLAFLHVSSRRVFLSPCTFQPDAAWMQQQAEAFLAHAKEQKLEVGMILRDRDSKYGRTFDQALKAGGAKLKVLSKRSPNLNAYMERFVQSIQQECLDRFIVFAEAHLDYVAKEYLAYYHQERPHQGKDNQPLVMPTEPAPATGEIVCQERLGGVLRHYCRKAA